MAQIQGGPAIPVSVVTGGKIKGGKAIPVYGYTSTPTDGRRAAAGPARPVYVVSDAQMAAGTFTLEGGPALPMYVSPSGLSVVGDAAQPVYVVGGSLGGAFTPASISGLVAWYDFSDAATLFTDSARTTPVASDGDVIGGLKDKSASANHFSSATTARPLYKTGIQNGKSIGRGDGSNDSMSNAGIDIGTTYTLFFAMKFAGSDTRIHISETAGRHYTLILMSGTMIGHGAGAGGVGVAHGMTLPQWAIIHIVRTNTSVSFYKNGTQIGTTQTLGANSNHIIGYLFSQNGSFSSAIDIGEIAVYTNNPSAANVSAMLSYLNTKWAVY